MFILLAKAWVGECVQKITIAPIPPATTSPLIEVATLKGFECLFANVLNVVIRLAGIGLLIMLIIGGFKYMTAGGEPKKIQPAQQTLTNAFLGLALIIGGWFIFRLISIFTGIDVLKFEILTR